MYNRKALLFAEKYGIVTYTLKNNMLTYYKNYPEYLQNKRYTVKTVVNLDTMVEVKIILKRCRNKL